MSALAPTLVPAPTSCTSRLGRPDHRCQPWRDRVPFVPFLLPLFAPFSLAALTCAPFENFEFVSLNPFF